MTLGQAGLVLLLIGAVSLVLEAGWLGLRLLALGRRWQRLRAGLAGPAAALEYEVARGRLLRLQLALSLAGLRRRTRLGRLAYRYYIWASLRKRVT